MCVVELNLVSVGLYMIHEETFRVQGSWLPRVSIVVLFLG